MRLTLAALAVCAVPANAQEPPQAVMVCGPPAQVEAALTSAGQHKVASGSVAAVAAMSMYADPVTGAWTMTVTEDGVACVVAGGGDFGIEGVAPAPTPPVAPIAPATPRGSYREVVV